MAPFSRALLALTASALAAAPARAYTDPQEVLKLLNLRDELVSRNMGYLLKSWTCPTANPLSCNPCGVHSGADDSWGYLNGGKGWEHIACRTYDMTPAEFGGFWMPGMNVSRMGVVTTIHLTDLGIEGTLESLKSALCPLSHLRELDLDGSHLTGPLPVWLADCFPHLRELDLSYGRLSGTIPAWVSRLGSGQLAQFKVQHNQLSGSIPLGFSKMPNLHILWLSHNLLAGGLPSDLPSSKSLISVDARFNAGLCGAVPASFKQWAMPNWEWLFDEARSGHVQESWFGFCDKAANEATACGLLVTQGTRIGRPCGSAASTTGACGQPFDQCGGAPTPSLYKGQAVSYDAYSGAKCCTSESSCVFKDQFYSQCIPNTVDSGDHSQDGSVDLSLVARSTASCAASSRQCAGAKGLWAGPSACCNPAERCYRLNYYIGLCLTPAAAADAGNTYGANVAAQERVVQGWEAARKSPS